MKFSRRQSRVFYRSLVLGIALSVLVGGRTEAATVSEQPALFGGIIFDNKGFKQPEHMDELDLVHSYEGYCARALWGYYYYTLNIIGLDPKKVRRYCPLFATGTMGVSVDSYEIGTCNIEDAEDRPNSKLSERTSQITVLECLDVEAVPTASAQDAQARLGPPRTVFGEAGAKARYKLLCGSKKLNKCVYAKVCGMDAAALARLGCGPVAQKPRPTITPACPGTERAFIQGKCTDRSALTEEQCVSHGVWVDGKCRDVCPDGTRKSFSGTGCTAAAEKTRDQSSAATSGGATKVSASNPNQAANCVRQGGQWYGNNCFPGQPSIGYTSAPARPAVGQSSQSSSAPALQNRPSLPFLPPQSQPSSGTTARPQCLSLETMQTSAAVPDPINISWSVREGSLARLETLGKATVQGFSRDGEATIVAKKKGTLIVYLRVNGVLQTMEPCRPLTIKIN